MDSIHSWMDKDEVSKLVEGLSTSPEKLKEWKKLESDGFAMPDKQGQLSNVTAEAQRDLEEEQENAPQLSEEVILQQRSSLAGASALARNSGLINSQIVENGTIEQKTDIVGEPEVSAPAAPAASPTGAGTFEEVAAMYKEQIGSVGVCAMDRDGDILFDQLDDPALTQFVSRVMQKSSLMQVAEGDFGSMRIKTSAEMYLEFTSVHSTRGVILIASKQRSATPVDKVNDLSDRLLVILNT